MSKQYDNTNKGVLFINDRKTSDTHPDMTGRINIDGVDYWLSGWGKKHDKRGKYLSLSVRKMEEQQPEDTEPISDDLPF